MCSVDLGDSFTIVHSNECLANIGFDTARTSPMKFARSTSQAFAAGMLHSSCCDQLCRQLRNATASLESNMNYQGFSYSIVETMESSLFFNGGFWSSAELHLQRSSSAQRFPDYRFRLLYYAVRLAASNARSDASTCGLAQQGLSVEVSFQRDLQIQFRQLPDRC